MEVIFDIKASIGDYVYIIKYNKITKTQIVSIRIDILNNCNKIEYTTHIGSYSEDEIFLTVDEAIDFLRNNVSE